MDWRKYLTGALAKEFGLILYRRLLYPMARDYVKKSDNKWDDMVLEFIDDFIGDTFGAKKEDLDKEKEKAS